MKTSVIAASIMAMMEGTFLVLFVTELYEETVDALPSVSIAQTESAWTV
jgi:hypothetical protein